MSRESERRAAREERRTAKQESAADQGAAGAQRTTPLEFLGEVRSELRKVAWPGRREVLNYTVIVLIVSTVLTLAVYGMDEVIRRAVFNTLG